MSQKMPYTDGDSFTGQTMLILPHGMTMSVCWGDNEKDCAILNEMIRRYIKAHAKTKRKDNGRSN